MLTQLGAQVLDLAQVPWSKLMSQTHAPGAPTPSVAKSALTRDSRRRAQLARQARLAALFQP